MTIRIEAVYPSGRKEVFTKQNMRNAIELGNRLKALGCTVNLKELPKR